MAERKPRNISGRALSSFVPFCGIMSGGFVSSREPFAKMGFKLCWNKSWTKFEVRYALPCQ